MGKSSQAKLAICALLLQHSLAGSRIQSSDTNSSNAFGLRDCRSRNETSSISGHLGSSIVGMRKYVDMEALARNPDARRLIALDSIYQFFYHRQQYHQVANISQFSELSLRAKFHSSVYSDLFLHRYDDSDELKESGGPNVDQELCLRQLRLLNERAEIQQREKFSSRDLNLIELLDTFGHVPSGKFGGDAYWPSHYSGCLRHRIDIPDGEKGFRYCVASFRHHLWPKDDVLSDFIVVKSAVCLPKACDSLDYKDKYALVGRLEEYNLREVERNQFNVSSLYCLPDDESSLRQWWRSPKSLATVVVACAWILIQLYATWRFSKISKGLENHGCDDQTRGTERFETTSALARKGGEDNYPAGCEKQAEGPINIYRSLSITNNLRLLFDTSKTSSLMEVAQNINTEDQNQEQALLAKPIVDLRVIEGIKVISMCYVMIGHVLMISTALMVNGRELADVKPLAYFIAYPAPALTVNVFFTITGLLTSYLMFKHNQAHSLFANPLKWISFALYRYLRIMPMYALVVLYCKTLARFTGSGPYWDYGTSAIAQRRSCQQESWLWTLLFASNFKSPVSHCIPSAWYLANDFQFFLVTPIFLAMLHKWPVWGQRAIKVCIAAGFLASFQSIYSSSLHDLRPIANFAPHAFKTYVTHFDYNYTQPQYRILAYLCGLLIGFALHNYERLKLEHLRLRLARECGARGEGAKSSGEPMHEPGWSKRFETKGMALSFILLALLYVIPAIGSMLPFNYLIARIMVALFTPSLHLMISLMVGMYIMLAATGFGSKLANGILSRRMWKPFARLSLCAVLTNVEVTSYFVLSRHRSLYIDNESLTWLNLVSIVGTYSVSIVLCVLFEAPIRSTLNQLISHFIAKQVGKQRTE